MFVSTDAGVTWGQSSAGLKDVTLSVDPSRESIPEGELRCGFGVTEVAISPSDPTHLYAGPVEDGRAKGRLPATGEKRSTRTRMLSAGAVGDHRPGSRSRQQGASLSR